MSNRNTLLGNPLYIDGSKILEGTIPASAVSGAYPNVTSLGTLTQLVISGDLTVDTNTLYVDSTNNRIGVGTTSPSVKADIVGAAKISGDLTVNTNTLFVDSANNRVGIGTTSPASRLHIADSNGYGIQVNTTTKLALLGSNNEDDGLRISGGIPDQVIVGGNIYLYGNSHATRPADVAINRNGTEVITVGSSGYVGIGTTSPNTILHVNGVITLANSNNNLITTSTTADSALPWSSGPVIQGATGWAFYSSTASGYRMGFRGSTGNTARYLWSADSALIGSSPSDAEVTNTLNVIGTGRFTGTVTAPTFSGNASTSTKASTLAQNGGSGTGMTFNWSGQSGQPTWLWGSNDGTNIYVWNPSNFSVSSAGSSNATTFTGTYVRMSGNGDADPHTEQGLQSGVGGTGAGVAMWASGVAPQFRVGASNNTVYLRNSNDTAYATLEGVITNASSIHLKQDIEEFPKIAKSAGAAVNELEFETGLDIVRRLRPVTYRWKEDEHFYQLPDNPRRALALSRLNKLRKENGLEQYTSDELRHDCARDNCMGTAENPCAWTRNWDIGNLGFISQEVGAIIPEAAVIGKDDEFTGLDAIGMIALTVSAIKELDAKVSSLTARIEQLEA